MEVNYMGKQKGHRNKESGTAITNSVNPLGKTPDEGGGTGEVLSKDGDRAKKKNTK